ncbi:MAG TPA: ABC transporter permease [Steroidobacteraceae bacterium]|nr:ABC transporter permease [Steroidobacteraceae bacterium]
MTINIAHAQGSDARVTAAVAAATARIFLLEAHSEFLRLLRAPSFCVPTIAFPLMFYVLFGILLGPGRAHPEAGARVLASFLVLGTMAPGLFALGITLATDRERGLLELKRALPMPRGLYLAAKVATAMLFAAVVSLLLTVLAVLVAGVTLTLLRWALLVLMAVVGVIPFCAIGLLVGSLCKGSATPAVLNLIYLPMSFLSGLWVPLSMLPRPLSQLAPLWPSWQLAQIAEAVVGPAPVAAVPAHALALTAIAAACFGAARRALGRAR